MPQPAHTSTNPKFTIELENGGTIRGELYPQFAPQTVGNFIALANGGFYDGMSFHRCFHDFLIQTGRADQALPYCIYGEFEFNGFEQNTLAHEPGSLGMVHGSGYDSASSQFYIALTDNERELSCMDGAYAVFGKVTQGLELAMEISRCATDVLDEPLRRQGIKSIRVDAEPCAFQKLEPSKPADGVRHESHRGQRIAKNSLPN